MITNRDTTAITVRPVYCRRSLRGYTWGVFIGDVLTVITCRYPSKLMQELAP